MARKSRRRNRNRKAKSQSASTPQELTQTKDSTESTDLSSETGQVETAAVDVAVLEETALDEKNNSTVEIAEETAVQADVELETNDSVLVGSAGAQAETPKTDKPRRRRRRSRRKSQSKDKTATVSETVETTLDEVVQAIDQCVEEPVIQCENETPIECEATPVIASDHELVEELAVVDEAIEEAAATAAETVEPIDAVVETTVEPELATTDEDVSAEPCEIVLPEPSVSPQQIREVIETNTAVLQQVVEQIGQLRAGSLVQPEVSTFEPQSDSQADSQCDADLLAEVALLGQQIEDLYQQLEEAKSDNIRLESELQAAPSGIEPSQNAAYATADSGQAMTWEQRKELMFQQMEDDSFDAESFVEAIQSSTSTSVELDVVDVSPADYVTQLNDEIDRIHAELQNRDDEISQLHEQLNDRSAVTNDMKSAAGTDGMLEVDALLQDERGQLQAKLKEWEERLKEKEVATSLQRAKLSREHRELTRKNAELEEQLMQCHCATDGGRATVVKVSRGWFTKRATSQD